MNKKQKDLHTRARELYTANRLQEALALYQKLFRLDNRDVQACHMAGAIAGMSGDFATARFYCEKVVSFNPPNQGPYLNLANILMATGHPEEALQRFQQALQLAPNDPQILTNLSNLHAQLGQFEQAIVCLQKAIKVNPRYPEAFNNLGNLYRELSQMEAAESCFRQALNLKPDYPDALCNLGALLSDQLKFSEAESCYKAALQYAPDNPAALRNLGDLYQSTGDFDRARARYEQALQQSPSDTRTVSSLANLHERCGDMTKALNLLAPLADVRHSDADLSIIHSKLLSKQGDDKAAVDILSDALELAARPTNVIDLQFALGDVYDHAGEYDRAFDCYFRANELDASRHPAQNAVSSLQSTAAFFSKDRLSKLPRSSNRSELPIFIVGMPRTGTSLVEQILATHPLVSAGGERGDIFTIIDSLTAESQQGREFPDLLESTSPDILDRFAQRHLDQVRTLAADSARFTDKTPLHGLHLGFISRLFPASRIILCKRNALDTCLSVYFHRFNAFHGYAQRLETLGAFYKAYYELMQHWSETLDIEILTVQYEDLVKDPEDHIRRIIDFCGLEWDSDCLSFHKNKRTVNTPSYDQVRRPIYTNSVERWRHYESHLDPLRAALNE